MNINHKKQLVLRQQSLKTSLVSNISKCLKAAVKDRNSANLDAKLKSAITRSIRAFEGNVKSSELRVVQKSYFESGFLYIPSFDSANPEIEKLKKLQSKLRLELEIKEAELKSLNRRASLTKDFTRNDAIKGLVGNIIKKFKTLPEERQRGIVSNEGKLKRIVKNYIQNLVVYYDQEENAWGISFKKDDVLDNLSTGKDSVILAINLSSKYVHLATSSIYHATKLQHEICRKERDELKSRLTEVNQKLQKAENKDENQIGFRGGFGGGKTGGRGASGVFR